MKKIRWDFAVCIIFILYVIWIGYYDMVNIIEHQEHEKLGLRCQEINTFAKHPCKIIGIDSLKQVHKHCH